MRRALLILVALLALAGCGDDGGDPGGPTTGGRLVDRDGDGSLERGAGERLPDGGRVLGALAQVTDAHVRDEESPARLPVLDRLGGPFRGTLRPHETLTPHLLAAMTRALNAIDLDAVVLSGDLIDSAQRNELEQALAVLDGGRVDPDSGRRGYDGIQAASNPDPLIYRPDLDAPRRPGLLERAQRPFRAPGLRAPWQLALGNHDLLVAGELAPDDDLRAAAVGSSAVVTLPAGVQPGELDRVATLDAVLEGRFGRRARVPADRDRALLSDAALLRRVARSGAADATRAAARAGGRLDYTFDAGALRVIVVDTVARGGGSAGELLPEQLGRLRAALAAAGDRWVVVLAHNPLGETRGGEEALAALDAHPRVAAVVSGHKHRHAIERRGRYWLVSTASLVDFPQQARVLRLVRLAGGRLALDTFVVDHDGRAGAGVARELAHLDAQGGRPLGWSGSRADRNRRLPLPAR
jgi:3',5'-cyclic AMP phosphodiesterase CpdA